MVGNLNSINKLNKRVRKLITKWITAAINKMTYSNQNDKVTRIVSGCLWASAPIFAIALLQQKFQKPDLIYEWVLSKTAITNHSLGLI